MVRERWKTIETEQATGEGYVVVPADGSYARYAAPSTMKLFASEELAWQAINRLVARGQFRADSLKPMRARFSHKRTVDVLEEPHLKVVR